MDVHVKFAFTKVTIGVRLTRLGPLEEGWDALQEIRRVVEMLDNPARLNEMKANARQRAIETFDIAKVLPEYMAIYEQVLGRKVQPAAAVSGTRKKSIGTTTVASACSIARAMQ